MIKYTYKNVIIVGIFLIFSLLFFQGCGPDESTLIAKEKELQDSLSMVQAELRQVQATINNIESDFTRCEIDLDRVEDKTKKSLRGEW